MSDMALGNGGLSKKRRNRRPRPESPPPLPLPRGIPVDAFGGNTIDPTKNVLDLVFAAVTRLDDLISAFLERQDDLRGALDKRVTELNEQRNAFDIRLSNQRDAYENRIENLKSQHQVQLHASESDFGKQIAQILAQQTEKNANLLATALAAVTERLAVVEKNQYVTGGQTAVRDPVVTQAIDSMGRQIEAIISSVNSLRSSTSATRDTDTGSKSAATQVTDQHMKMYMLLVAMGALGLPVLLHFVK